MSSQSARETDLGRLILSHSGEWTQQDFEAFPTDVSTELHDGRLILTPSARFEHMDASYELVALLKQYVDDRHTVSGEVDIYCGPDNSCIRKPDLLGLRKPQRGRPVPADNVLFVGEIVSPGGKDQWGDKMTDYAEAGIEWYLIVQETPVGFRAELHRLLEGRYDLVTEAGPAGVLRMAEPYRLDINLRDLSY